MNNSITKGQKSFFSKEMNKLKEEFGELKNKIISFEKSIYEGSDNEIGIKTKIENFINEIQENKDIINSKKEELEKIYIEYLGGEGNEGKKEELDLLFSNISGNYEKINNYYNKIFGLKNEEGVLEGGLKEKIEGIKNELEEENKKSKELQIIIEKQLSLATSVGLASAYQNNRKSFFWSKIGWNILFLLSIILMVIVAIWSSIDLDTFNFIKYESFYQSFNFIFSKIPFILPLVWLALYSSKQQAQNKRLEQEYYHKEAIALTYDSYKKEIEKLGDGDDINDILKKLMGNMIDMTKENPSITLDKINNHNLPISNFNLFNNKKENE